MQRPWPIPERYVEGPHFVHWVVLVDTHYSQTEVHGMQRKIVLSQTLPWPQNSMHLPPANTVLKESEGQEVQLERLPAQVRH